MKDVSIFALDYNITHVKGFEANAAFGLALLCWHNRRLHEGFNTFILFQFLLRLGSYW